MECNDMAFLKIFIAAVIFAIFSYFSAERVAIGDLRIYSGLLALIAVGVFGLIWREEAGDDKVGRPTIGIAIFAFFTAFILADNLLVGHEKMSAILLSFIAVGILGLTTIKKKSNNVNK